MISNFLKLLFLIVFSIPLSGQAGETSMLIEVLGRCSTRNPRQSDAQLKAGALEGAMQNANFICANAGGQLDDTDYDVEYACSGTTFTKNCSASLKINCVGLTNSRLAPRPSMWDGADAD